MINRRFVFPQETEEAKRPLKKTLHHAVPMLQC